MSERPDDPSEEETIGETARAVGLDLDSPALRGLLIFARLFLRWNERINLGGDVSFRELVHRHFLDAFAARRFFGPHGQAVDVGSGGGLPALPLAIACAGWRFALYEPTAKKVAFLRTAVRETGLSDRVVIHSTRVDASERRQLAGTFDAALSRATFAPADWLPVGLGLVRPGGRVLVFGTGAPTAIVGAPAEMLSYAPNRTLSVYVRT